MQIIELMDNIKKQVEELENLIKTDPVQEWLDDVNSIQKNSNSLEEKMKERNGNQLN